RSRSYREIPCGLRRARVDVLIRVIERRRENRALLPLERVLFSAAAAEQRFTGAGDHKHDLFKQVFLRLQGLSRRNLAKISVIGPVITNEIDERSQTSSSLPRLELRRCDILDVKSSQNRNSLRFDPPGVHTLFD